MQDAGSFHGTVFAISYAISSIIARFSPFSELIFISHYHPPTFSTYRGALRNYITTLSAFNETHDSGNAVETLNQSNERQRTKTVNHDGNNEISRSNAGVERPTVTGQFAAIPFPTLINKLRFLYRIKPCRYPYEIPISFLVIRLRFYEFNRF